MSATFFAGEYRAYNFAYGINPQVPPLVVDIGTTATGAGTLTLAFGQATTPDGIVFSPLATTAPVTIGSTAGSDAETQTPSAVSAPTPGVYDTTTVTATWTYTHGKGEMLSSGTVGLQEAINFANGQGGGVVLLDAKWASAGGTSAMITAASIPVGVSIVDNRTGGTGSIQTLRVAIANAAVLTLGTASDGVLLVPAAGTLEVIDVIDMVVEHVFKTAAFTLTGVLQASYGNATTFPATATIASTFLTGPAASTIIKVAGALTATNGQLMSNVAGTAVYLNTTGAVAAGGGSLIVSISYRVVADLA
jgi:hypothetical protein